MTAITPPELPPLIVNRSGKNRYVFTYKNHWDPRVKRSTRGKGDTTSVGKLIEVDGSPDYGEILFNEEFKAKYPQLRQLRVFRWKGGKLEFKPVDEEVVTAATPGSIVKLHAGATWALNQIAGASPLGKALREAFPKYKQDVRILSLACYIVLSGDSSLCNYEEFAESTWLPYRHGTTSASCSRLLRAITEDTVSKFLNRLIREYCRQHGEAITARRFWALDSTSGSSYPENIASVEYGYNKDMEPLPQANVLLIADQKTGEEICYRNFDGNVPDVCALRNTLAELTMMGIDCSNVILVTDHGYGSHKNWDDLLRNNISFVCNARLNLNALIKQTIDEHYAELLDWNNRIPFIKQNAVTVPIVWKYDEYPAEGKHKQRNAEKTLYIHLYFNKDINDEAERRLQTSLTGALAQMSDDPGKLTEHQKQLIKKYTEKQDDGKLRINMYKVDTALRYSGVRMLVSDCITDALECCVAYEERNQVEYAFTTLKARLGCNYTGVHSTKAWEARVFLQVLATAISGMVRARIKLYNETAKKDTGKYRVHYDSDARLLAKLNNVCMTEVPNGWIFDEVADKHRELFQILNVPVPAAEQVFARDAEGDVFEEADDVSDVLLEDVLLADDSVEDL